MQKIAVPNAFFLLIKPVYFLTMTETESGIFEENVLFKLDWLED